MERARYRDFDEFAESVRDVDAQMLFRNPTERSWEIEHLNMASVHVQLGRLGSGNIVEGVSGTDGYLLYLPLTDDCPYSANGEAIPKYGFMVLEPGCEFCISTPSEHDWCTIMVPAASISPADEDKMVCRVTRPNRVVAEQFLDLVKGPLAAASEHPSFEGSAAATAAADDLVSLGTRILGARGAVDSPKSGRPRVSRKEVVHRSLQLLAERSGSRTKVAELAAASGVSERTLRSAFKEYFGVGPVRYLMLRKLHRVQRTLRLAGPDETLVSEVLFNEGIWELGRFASQYQRHFGELPSETLRRPRRR